MRLLIYGHHSDTGFGRVTKEIGERLVRAGIDVRVLAMNHRGEPVKGDLAGRVYPLGFLEQHFNNLSARAIDGTLWERLTDDEWKPDGILAVADVSGLLGYIGPHFEAWRTVPIWHYCPIEGDNLQPLWRQLWQVIQPVAMSDYGARVIGEHIGREVPRIYHGVDSDTFHPATPGNPLHVQGTTLRSKDDCKELFGVTPDRKVLFRADRNAKRKRYDLLLRAFGEIAAADESVDLVLHCLPHDAEGIDLRQEIMRLPEDIAPRVKFTNMHDTFRGLDDEGLCALYNAADIYVSTTGGEGFGLTLAESIASGTPVVTTGWAAEVEVVGPGGVIVPPLHDSYGEPVRDHSAYGMDWAVPDPRAFVEPVLNLLAKPGVRRSLAADGRLHVKRSFSWDECATAFLDLITTPVAEAAA